MTTNLFSFSSWKKKCFVHHFMADGSKIYNTHDSNAVESKSDAAVNSRHFYKANIDLQIVLTL